MSAVKGVWNAMVNMSTTGKIASSLILKDAVGCYLYVNQARKNKEMSPKQRADVANYDLANGVINIGLQMLAVKPIETAMKKVVDSKLAKRFFNNLDERLASNNSKSVMKLLKNKKRLTEGAVALFSVIVCQYIIKRCISPFFSVPLAEKAKNMGLVKPKIYEGETLDSSSEQPKKLDVTSTPQVNTTNLVEKYKQEHHIEA